MHYRSYNITETGDVKASNYAGDQIPNPVGNLTLYNNTYVNHPRHTAAGRAGRGSCESVPSHSLAGTCQSGEALVGREASTPASAGLASRQPTPALSGIASSAADSTGSPTVPATGTLTAAGITGSATPSGSRSGGSRGLSTGSPTPETPTSERSAPTATPRRTSETSSDGETTSRRRSRLPKPEPIESRKTHAMRVHSRYCPGDYGIAPSLTGCVVVCNYCGDRWVDPETPVEGVAQRRAS